MVHNRLKQLLEETGTSQRQLAEALGKSKTTINKLARNEPHDLLQLLEDICNYFGVGIEELLYIPRREEHSS